MRRIKTHKSSTLDWTCKACGEVDLGDGLQCAECGYFRYQVWREEQPPTADAPKKVNKRLRSLIDSQTPNYTLAPKSIKSNYTIQNVLEETSQAFTRLALRAKIEGREVSELERVDVYREALCTLLETERPYVREALFKEQRDRLKHKYMTHLTLMWFLGILTGLALYFALASL